MEPRKTTKPFVCAGLVQHVGPGPRARRESDPKAISPAAVVSSSGSAPSPPPDGNRLRAGPGSLGQAMSRYGQCARAARRESTRGSLGVGRVAASNRDPCHYGTFCQMGTNIDRMNRCVSAWNMEDFLSKTLFGKEFVDRATAMGISWHLHCVLNTEIRVNSWGVLPNWHCPRLVS